MSSRINLLWVPNKHTYGSHVISVGTFGSHNPPKAFFLGRTVGFIQVSLSIAVHHAPLAVQHTKAVPARETRLSVPGNSARRGGHVGWGIQLSRCPLLTSALTPRAPVSFPYKTRIATTCFMSLNNLEMRERKLLSMNPTMKSMQHG